MTPAVRKAIEAMRRAQALLDAMGAVSPPTYSAIAEALAGLEAEAAQTDANAAIALVAAPEGLAEDVAKAMREGKG